MKYPTKINNPNKLGEYIRQERKQLQLTQKEISDFKAREKFQSLPVDIKCNALAEQVGTALVKKCIVENVSHSMICQ